MKIHQDVNSVTAGQGLHRGQSRPLSANRTPVNARQQQPLQTANHSINRALSLSRMSMNIIQEAMVLSSQLRNIASRTMTTGDLNKRQLEETMANLSSLSRVNQRTQQADVRVSPMTILPPPPVSGGVAEIDDLSQMGRRMDQGENIPPDTFDALDRRLQERFETARVRDAELSAAAGMPHARSLNSETALQTMRSAGDLITGQRDQALAAQGNLSGDTAAVLLKS